MVQMTLGINEIGRDLVDLQLLLNLEKMALENAVEIEALAYGHYKVLGVKDRELVKRCYDDVYRNGSTKGLDGLVRLHQFHESIISYVHQRLTDWCDRAVTRHNHTLLVELEDRIVNDMKNAFGGLLIHYDDVVCEARGYHQMYTSQLATLSSEALREGDMEEHKRMEAFKKHYEAIDDLYMRNHFDVAEVRDSGLRRMWVTVMLQAIMVNLAHDKEQAGLHMIISTPEFEAFWLETLIHVMITETNYNVTTMIAAWVKRGDIKL